MNNQPYYSPPPAGKTGNKTAIIIIAVVVVLCCLCTTVAGGGAAAYYFWNWPARQGSIVVPTPIEEAIPVQEDTPVIEDTQAPEDTSIPEDTPIPEEQPTATLAANNPKQPAGAGLGVSRSEMIEFYSSGGAFKFGAPTTVQGLEIVQGAHAWLCVDKNCAAVTLGGPEEDLLVISVVVPTKPGDNAQTILGILVLMTTSAYFADAQSANTLPQQIMQDLLQAQSSGKKFDKKIENNGFIFTEMYDATTHNAGLAVSRPK